MDALERQIKKINRLYAEMKNIIDKNLKAKYRKHIKELEDDLLEYCSWRNLNYKEVCKKIVK